MPKPIEEQVIVITGASSGIGLATAIEAARRGAKVVMAARNQTDLQRAAEAIRRDGGDALEVPTDVADAREVQALAGAAVERYGRIDSWVNNAAVSTYATFREQPADDFRRVMEVNFMGQVNGARAALPYLERSEGALICVGSALSDRGIPLQGAYCASKHALKGWLDSLRVELRHEGSKVRVTLIKPSSINTPLFNKAKSQMGVQPMPIPPVYEPELAAEAILRAAEGSARDLFVGGAGKAFSVAERVSPRLVDLQQNLQGFESQKTDWPKRAEAPHNLYRPVAYDGGVRGDFVDLEKHGSAYQRVEAHSVVAPLMAAAVLGALAGGARRRGGVAVPALLGAGAAMLTGKGLLSAAGR
jgi:NAD(P)-dependent dehydrogenase (short-subunit alcohol dehydrogenase family)